MADLSLVAVNNAGAIVAGTATQVGGDTFLFNGRKMILFFTNGHASSITVTFAPVDANVQSPAGVTPVPTRSLVIAAGAVGVFEFTPEDIIPYLNKTTNRLAAAYTGHNAALLVRAIEAG